MHVISAGFCFRKVDQRVGGVKWISENSCSSSGLFSDLGNCATFRTLCVSVRGRLCTRGRLFEFRRICAIRFHIL